MKKFTIISILFVLAISLFVSPRSARAAGNIYYVATNGSDSASGSQSAPWKTIQKAATVARAGDTVYVRGGTYNEKVVVQNSGSAGNFITFSAQPGETVTIDVSGVNMTEDIQGGFTISEISYVQVIGFRVVNSKSTGKGGFGIVCYMSDHCVIKNNYTYNTYHSGIIVRSSANVTVDGNEVELANNDGSQEMITIARSEFVTVTNNHVHHGGPGNNGGEGIDVKNGSHDILVKGNRVHHVSRAGIYVDAYDEYTYNITIEGNLVYANERSGIAIEAENNGSLLKNVSIINNIVYSNVRTGIILGDWGYGHLENIFIVNNTVAENGIGNGHGGIGLWNGRAKNVKAVNNILSGNGSFTIEAQGTPLSEITISHNLFDGFRNGGNEERGTNYVMGEAGFTNASAADFSLRAASPAIDAGTATNAPVRDIAGTTRPNAAAHDIGAYEFKGSAPQPETILVSNFNASLNGWSKTGNVATNAIAPTLGARSVKMTGGAGMSRAISTQGYASVTLVIYLGAKSYESAEQLKLTWWDGATWRVLTVIRDGTARENAKLNKIQIKLPAAAADNPNFMLRIQQLNADADDFGYVDEVKLIGTPK
jgi:hypothetical protein